MYINRLHDIGCMCNEKIGDIQRINVRVDLGLRCMCNEKIGDIQHTSPVSLLRLWCMCNEKIGDIQRYTSDIQLAKL